MATIGVVERPGLGRLEPVAFWFALLVAAGLLLLLVGVISGALAVEEPSSIGETTAAIPTITPAEPATETTATATRSTVPAADEPDDVVLVRAVGGDCWVEAREGSATGAVLFAGLLERGSAQRLTARRVWLRLGAGQNVEITVGGKRADVPAGTSDLVVSA